MRLNVIEATDAEALYDNHPDRFDEMDVKSQTTLREWIRRTYEPSDTAYRLDSYAMKHQFERSEVSFYVDNGQFKGAMLAEGFEPVDAHPFPVFNWSFNVVKVREEEDRADLICWEALEPGEPLDLQTWMEEAVKAGVTAEQFVAAVVRLDADGRVVKDADVPLWTTREGAVIWKWVKRGGSRDREKDTDAWCLVILS